MVWQKLRQRQWPRHLSTIPDRRHRDRDAKPWQQKPALAVSKRERERPPRDEYEVPRRGGFRGNHERRKSNEGCTWLETRSSGRVGAIYRRQWVIWRYSGYVEHCQQCLSTVARRWRENASLLACTRQSTGWSEIRQPEETTSWLVGLTKRISADAGWPESDGLSSRRPGTSRIAEIASAIGIYHVSREAINDTINLRKVGVFVDVLDQERRESPTSLGISFEKSAFRTAVRPTSTSMGWKFAN